jgi:hypothetical protein
MDAVQASAELKKHYLNNPGDWVVLKNYLEMELLDTWKLLSKLSITQDETQQYRGRAAFITKLLTIHGKPTDKNGPLL